MKYEKREELRKVVMEFKDKLSEHLTAIDDLTDEHEDDEPLLCLFEGVESLMEDCDELLEEEAL